MQDYIGSNEYLAYSLIAIVGGAISTILGGWTEALTTLIICIVIDIVLGFGVALKGKSSKSISGFLSSSAMWRGAFKKGCIFAIIIICYHIDLLLETELVRNMAILFYIAGEIVSIIENCNVLGIKVPKVLIRIIDTLKERSGEKE